MTHDNGNIDIDTQVEDEVLVDEQYEVDEPSMFKVILHDDNVTTFDFVIAALMHIFSKNQMEAVEITLEVHKNGSGIAGVYTHEIAEQKAMETMTAARSEGYPLVATFEEL